MITGCELFPALCCKWGTWVPVSRDYRSWLLVSVFRVLSSIGLGHSVATGGLQPSRRTALFGVFPHDLLYDCISI